MYKYISTIVLLLILSASLSAQTSKIVQSDGLFFTDATQTKLYSGEYKEFFDNGALKVEMNIKEGKPEGAYIVYFANGKPNEVRAYRNGEFHGLWRTYNEAGMLIAEAEYRNNKNTAPGTFGTTRASCVTKCNTPTVKIRHLVHVGRKGRLISEKKY